MFYNLYQKLFIYNKSKNYHKPTHKIDNSLFIKRQLDFNPYYFT